MRRGTFGAGIVCALLYLTPAAQAAEQQAYAAADTTRRRSSRSARATRSPSTTSTRSRSTTSSSDDGTFASPTRRRRRVGAGRGCRRSSTPGTYQFHCTLHSWMHGAHPGRRGRRQRRARPSRQGRRRTPATRTPTRPTSSRPPPRAARRRRLAAVYGRDIANSRDGGAAGPSATDVPNLGVVWSFCSHRGRLHRHARVADGVRRRGARRRLGLRGRRGDRQAGWARARRRADQRHRSRSPAGRVFVPVAEANAPRVAGARRCRPAGSCGTSSSTRRRTPTSTAARSCSTAPSSSACPASTARPATRRRRARRPWSPSTRSTGADALEDLHRAAGPRRRRGLDDAGDRPRHGPLFVGTGNAYHAPAADTTDAVLRSTRAPATIAQPLPGHPPATSGTGRNRLGPRLRLRRLAEPVHRTGRPQAGRRSARRPARTGRSTARRCSPCGIAGRDRDAVASAGSWARRPSDGTRIYGPATAGGESVGARHVRRVARVAVDRRRPAALQPDDGGQRRRLHERHERLHDRARGERPACRAAKLPLGAPSWGGVSVAGGSVFTAPARRAAPGYIAALPARSPATSCSSRRPLGRGRDAVVRGCREPGPREEAQRDAKPHAGQEDAPQEEAQAPCARASTSATRKKRHQEEAPQEEAPQRRSTSRTCRSNRACMTRWATTPTRTMPMDPYDPMVGPGGGPVKALRQLADHWVPKPAGTTQKMSFYFGPFTVPPGQDMNRVDLELPLHNGFIVFVEPTCAASRTSPSPATRRRTSTTRTGSRSTRATRGQLHPTATPSGSSATATRRPRRTSVSAAAADPNGPDLRRVHRRRATRRR